MLGLLGLIASLIVGIAPSALPQISNSLDRKFKTNSEHSATPATQVSDNLTPLPDESLKVRSPNFDTCIDSQKPHSGSQLGSQTTEPMVTKAPIPLEELPRVKPYIFTLTAIEQRVNATGSQPSSFNYTGELVAVGTFLRGSWYIQVNQPDFLDSPTWYLDQAQYLQQTDSADYVIGSQPTFWRSQSTGDYWGFTTIQRRRLKNQDATFSSVPEQLPAGASVTIISGGFQRQVSGGQKENFLGELKTFQGGIAERWGISNDLTLGMGGVYDQTLKGLGELVFRPSDIPLDVVASVLSPDQEGTWDVEASVRYELTPGITAQFNSDRASQSFSLNWQVSPNITLLGTYDLRDGTTVGIKTALNGKGFLIAADATLDEQNGLRWNARQRLGFLELTEQGNETGWESTLNYNFSGSLLDNGHALLLAYKTKYLERSDRLAIVGWRYRSKAVAADGNSVWETQLGYGFGSQGSGIIATVKIAAIPGLLLKGSYEGLSLTSDEENYSLEFALSLNIEEGIFPGDRQIERFRTEGGVIIQPFFDRNNNGKRDRGEEVYTENLESLLTLNHKPIQSFNPKVLSDSILLRLPPGTYRLALDPSGFPDGWQAPIDAYAVEVVAGNYTSVRIPLRMVASCTSR
ncbi:MAG: hypothetical protein AB1589_15580 [Cyanobacteriota bacterium]